MTMTANAHNRQHVKRVRREVIWNEGYDYSMSAYGRYIRVRRDTYTVSLIKR
jgi:hypothetical protein